jgi:hypothetical protein
LPGLGQSVREQWKGAGLAFGIPYEEVHQPVFKTKTGLFCRSRYRLPKVVSGGWAQKMKSSLDQGPQFGVSPQLSEMVTADHHNDLCLLARMPGQFAADRAHVNDLVECIHLLKLVDHEGDLVL